jgi:hypothetical protein
MKSERRHELKESALANELVKLGQFLKKRGNLIAWGVLIAAVIALLIVWYLKSEAGKDERIRGEFSQALMRDDEPSLQTLMALSEQTREKRVAAEAALAVAERLQRMAVLGEKIPAEVRQQQMQRAGEFYAKALRTGGQYSTVAAKAHMGLARIAEMNRDFDAAATEYQAAYDVAIAGEPVKAQAKAALDRLPQLREPVRMASTAPSTAPASAPATAPAAGAATAPAATAPATGPATSPAK